MIELYTIAEEEDIQIVESSLPCGLSGLYADNTIAIDKNMRPTAKACILAEELGHHYTSHGDIIEQSKLVNRKQELRARGWAFEKLLPLEKFVAAFEHGCRNLFEIADFLDVTETFITESVEYYKRKYGIFAVSESGHVVYFDPLGVMRRI